MLLQTFLTALAILGLQGTAGRPIKPTKLVYDNTHDDEGGRGCQSHNLIENGSFDIDFSDGAPWMLENNATISHNAKLSRSGNNSVFFNITNAKQHPTITKTIEGATPGQGYTFTYYYRFYKERPISQSMCYVQGPDGQPMKESVCYLRGSVNNGQHTTERELYTPLQDVYIRQQINFAATNGPFDVSIQVACMDNAGQGVEVYVDDISIHSMEDTCRPASEENGTWSRKAGVAG
ncbi:hypothetical protein FALBO_13072 [Fusarium albosuccineum]|uniref:Uncharacterized protein n=1 Tax=Fusarium albosuccineum TaxID=1237068 RepID=A0A8H4L2R4_9HYPO|nr:hypothetical protein FALBO_13072 [Fusarium albosuccineum]